MSEGARLESEYRPKRGDDVEAWLKRHRDALNDQRPLDSRNLHEWEAIDRLLNRYRECSDYGLTLGAKDGEQGDG